MSHDITAQRRLVDSLREADQRKSEFIGVLSHELRNPLAAIRTSLHVLAHDRAEKVATDRAREVIDRQVSHLARMVDDLLDVTRIAQNKIRLQRRRVDVNQLVREATEDNRAQFEAAGVRLAVKLADRPLYVHADGARVAQVVTNLLSNAVKFTASGGTTAVSVSADEAGSAVLTVADTGSGIDAALLPRVFEPFVQGDHTLDRTGGGPRRGPGAGQGAGRPARRRGARQQRGQRPGRRVRRPAAAGGGGRAARQAPRWTTPASRLRVACW